MARNAFTKKYSQHMIPETGGKATASKFRKKMNLLRMPKAPAALPMIPQMIVTMGRGARQPHTSKKATIARPEKYKFVQLITISPATTITTAHMPAEVFIIVITSSLPQALAITTPAIM